MIINYKFKFHTNYIEKCLTSLKKENKSFLNIQKQFLLNINSEYEWFRVVRVVVVVSEV